MYPKRYEELINGGSIYWIFKGYIRARQNILDMNRYIGEDKISNILILDKALKIKEIYLNGIKFDG